VINVDELLKYWDDFLRVAGSIKIGWVTASLFVAKLQSYPRSNALLRWLKEYGRLIRTIFILRWIDDPNYRRRIGGQLNKGESGQSVHRFLLSANEGKIRKRHYDEQLDQAACLNLVSNAIVVWNTVYIQAILDRLKEEGKPAALEDVAHISPARFKHINPHGKFRFDLDAVGTGRLRPLRERASV
jgi:TnpA family transposase